TAGENLNLIWRPSEAFERGSPLTVVRCIEDFSRLSILHEEPPSIGFETGPRLRAPSEILSVRRIKRRGVGARACGNFLCHAAADRHDKNFVVRAGRFDLIDLGRVRTLLCPG